MAAVIVYDVTNRVSYANVVRWLRDLRDNAEPDIAIMLVGNQIDKCETVPGNRQVPIEQARQFANDNDLMFIETSAVNNIEVEPTFHRLLESTPVSHLLETYKVKQEQGHAFKTLSFSNELKSSPAPRKSGCC